MHCAAPPKRNAHWMWITSFPNPRVVKMLRKPPSPVFSMHEKGNTDSTDLRNDTPTESDPECKFCYQNIKGRIIEELDTVVAIKDGYPVTKGHTLVIPKRHAPEYFDLSDLERRDVDSLLKFLKQQMYKHDPSITGYNIGINNGESAGQTIFHVHFHLIPRRNGDTENPRGGVRGVIPGKRSY